MPTYDFFCDDCLKESELFLSLAERDGNSNKKICFHCGSVNVRQLPTFNGGILNKGLETQCKTPSCCSGANCPMYGHSK